MVVRLRLARFGKAHAPVYNIVVMHARYVAPTLPAAAVANSSHSTARDSKPLEVIGTYDPIPKPPADGIGKPVKDIQLDTVRAKYWLGVGAQPSDPVWRLMSMVRSLGVLSCAGTDGCAVWVDRAQVELGEDEAAGWCRRGEAQGGEAQGGGGRCGRACDRGVSGRAGTSLLPGGTVYNISPWEEGVICKPVSF